MVTILKEIIILHNLNGKPYYEAIEYYAKQNNLKVSYYESSIFKLFVRDIIKTSFSLHSIQRSIKNLYFRFKVPFIKNKTIILGMAPYDFRIIWYRLLMNNNQVIYSISWPFWDDKDIPRKYSFLTPIFKLIWKQFIEAKKLKIVAVTKATHEGLINNFQINGSITQIYHTVDLTKFTTNEKRDLNNKIRILFVGSLIKQKGLDTLVHIINALNPLKYEFSIVGDGEYKKSIEQIFERGNVNYYGYIGNKDELSKIFKSHHIFLNPSVKTKKWQELFGIVNIEAMAAGLVVIASNHVGPSEIITNGINGFLVEENKPEQIMNILLTLEKNSSEYNKISQNAKVKAAEFDIKNISQQWLVIINE